MISWNDVKQIYSKISLENMGVLGDTLSEDISCIIYHIDVFECGDTSVIDRHINIEYSFGEYYEIHEGTPLFQAFCSLCDLPLLQEQKEMVLYQKVTCSRHLTKNHPLDNFL